MLFFIGPKNLINAYKSFQVRRNICIHGSCLCRSQDCLNMSQRLTSVLTEWPTPCCSPYRLSTLPPPSSLACWAWPSAGGIEDKREKPPVIRRSPMKWTQTVNLRSQHSTPLPLESLLTCFVPSSATHRLICTSRSLSAFLALHI